MNTIGVSLFGRMQTTIEGRNSLELSEKAALMEDNGWSIYAPFGTSRRTDSKGEFVFMVKMVKTPNLLQGIAGAVALFLTVVYPAIWVLSYAK